MAMPVGDLGCVCNGGKFRDLSVVSVRLKTIQYLPLCVGFYCPIT